MNFDLTDDQEMMRDMFARFLDENSSMARVRAASPSGFDATLWTGLAEALIAARLLAQLGGEQGEALLARAMGGEAVLTLALHDAAVDPV